MKIALVCDDMLQRGGQERLVMGIIKGLSVGNTLEVYTPLISAHWRASIEHLGIKVHTSIFNYLPGASLYSKVLAIFGCHIAAISAFDLSTADVVLSVSARFAHFASTNANQKHVCYMNSPGRMYWESPDYFSQMNLPPIFHRMASPLLSMFRLLDFGAAQRVDLFIANSQFIQKKIKKYYQRDSEFLYPFSDLDDSLIEKVKSQLGTYKRGKFYLVLTRLNAWKRIDIAIQAVGELGGHLKVVGEGPHKNALQKLARQYPQAQIEFLGYVSEDHKIELLFTCKALIITQKEDFGLTALEAKKCGTPVVAYGYGGVLETVKTPLEGVFFFFQQSRALGSLLH